ncbi:hypothetical protein IAR50_002089 [Cryptococcus sp. DSM 104548]
MSDSDDSDDFFVSKRKPTMKASTPLPVLSPSPEPSEDDLSDSGKKKKRRPNKKAEVKAMPEWTRPSSETRKERERKRSERRSTESKDRGRSTSMAVVQEEPEMPVSRRSRVVLTPPPPISAKKQQEIKDLVQSMYGEKPEDEEEEDAPPEADEDSLPSPNKDEVVDITVRLELDPIKRERAPAMAIKKFEMPRTVKIRREDSMFRVLEVIGDKLNKGPDDFVLVYDGQRVWASDSPKNLKIFGGSEVDMTGYEKPHWDKMEKERRHRLEKFNLPDDGGSVTTTKPDGTNAALETTSASPAPPEEAAESIRLTVRGSDGQEAKIKVSKNVSAHTVLRFYCKKVGRPKEDADGLQLVFDGDNVDNNEKMGNIDCEDGDMLEVRKR